MDVREKLVELLGDKLIFGRGILCEIASHLIDNGVTVQEWISVKDRLPEESGEDLTCCGEHDGSCILYCDSPTAGRRMIMRPIDAAPELGGNGGKAWNLCPNCGARMKEGLNDNP